MSTIEKAMAAMQGKEPDKKNTDSQLVDEHLSEESASPDKVEASQSGTLNKAASAEVEKVEQTEDAEVTNDKAPQVSTPQLSTNNETCSENAEVAITAQDYIKQPPADDKTQKSSAKNGRYVELDITYLNRKGYVSKDSDNKIIKEQFRAIKRKLLNNAFGPLASTLNHPNLIIVSSCNPHEGKTFSSINLALNIALERDKTVLLVDADVVRPSIVRELGVSVESGLTEFLSGHVSDVSEIIHDTNIDNFKFIPAGKPHDLSTELLASQKMVDLTQELATRYSDRVVIFDAPPLLGVNETHVMANHVGQAVIVVEEGKTKLNDIKAAVGQLDEQLALGFLMNKSKRSWRDYYGYGYGYYRKD